MTFPFPRSFLRRFRRLLLRMAGKPDFSKLLEQSRQLGTALDASGYTLQRSIEQIDETSKRLAAKSAHLADVPKTKAQILLASKGFDVEKLARNLHSIDLKRTFEPLEPLKDTDIEGFLRHQHEMIVLTAIEEAKQEALKQFEDNYVKVMVDDWENAKKELMEQLGMRTAAPAMSQGATRSLFAAGSTQPTAPGRRGRSAMDSKMMEYSRVIYSLNEAKSKDQPFDLLSAFTEVASKIDDRDARRTEVVDSWNIVQFMLQSDSQRRLHAGCYEKEYTSGSKDLRLSFVRGGRRFLEHQYHSFVRNFVAANASQAQMGGVPGALQEIRAFLNVFLKKGAPWPNELEERHEGFPLWAELYFLVRCGEWKAALELAKVVEHINFMIYLNEYLQNNGRLSNATRSQMISEWNREVSRSPDEYQQALYLLIGKCDLSKTLPRVFKTTQDFLWLRLNLIESSENQAVEGPLLSHASVTLEQLQTMLLTHGADHFTSKGRNFLLYFQVLLLSQQFERAIFYLHSTDTYRVESVHFAAALYYYGVLRQPPANDVRDFMFYEVENGTTPVLNFERLLRQYVRDFAVTDVLEAVHYFNLLRSPVDRCQCLKDLVLETKEFEALLGGVQPDSTRKAGYLERYASREDVLRITELAADECESTGRHEDATRLFDLAEKPDKVLAVLHAQLSKNLVRGADRERIAELAQVLFKKYRSDPRVSAFTRSMLPTTDQLLSLMDFFDAYAKENWTEALTIIERLGIIPLDMRTVPERAEAFRTLDGSIARNFAEVLLAVMTILWRMYGQLKNIAATAASMGDQSVDQTIRNLRAKGRALVTFAGMIHFRMPIDTHQRLMKMDVWMQS